MYKEAYHSRVKKDLKKIAPHIRKEILKKHIPAILSNPFAGERLGGDLSNVNSYHFTTAKQQFRIAYMMDDDTIRFLMIGKRADFYKRLKKRAA